MAGPELQPTELIVDGITEDAQTFRETLYLLHPTDMTKDEIRTELQHLLDTNELSWTTIMMLDDTAFDNSRLTPAHLDRDTFLNQVQVLPNSSEPFGFIPQLWIELPH